MEDLAVFTALNHSGSFGKNFVKFKKLGLENAALGLRPRAVFSRPQSQFFTIRTSQPANNIYCFSFLFSKFKYLYSICILISFVSKYHYKFNKKIKIKQMIKVLNKENLCITHLKNWIIYSQNLSSEIPFRCLFEIFT